MEPPRLPTDAIHKELLENLYDGICFINSERKVTFWNTGAERITGRPAKQVLGILMGSDILQHIDEAGFALNGMNCPLVATATDASPREMEIYIRHAEGYPIPVLVKTFPIFSKTGRLVGAAELFSDNPVLTRAKRRAESLEQTLAYDPLTLVGNRKHLEHRLRGALLEFQYSNIPFGILFIDIDNFKAFNDEYGHIIGDKVLHVVANTLRHNLRDTDTAGRWGGEEFLAIVFDVEEEEIKTLAEKLRLLVKQTIIPAKGRIPSITISVGGTIVQPNDTLESLIHRADKLMYKSKAGGKNRVTTG
jgi:diguanylate cyclase (GGDEF)-like protein/PAS domain S-box-containing protein